MFLHAPGFISTSALLLWYGLVALIHYVLFPAPQNFPHVPSAQKAMTLMVQAGQRMHDSHEGGVSAAAASESFRPRSIGMGIRVPVPLKS